MSEQVFKKQFTPSWVWFLHQMYWLDTFKGKRSLMLHFILWIIGTMKVKKRNMLGKYNRKKNNVNIYIDHNPKWDDKSRQERDWKINYHRTESMTESLDSYFCWSPPVVLRHTVCSIGPKYIIHTVVDRLLNEFWYRFPK